MININKITLGTVHCYSLSSPLQLFSIFSVVLRGAVIKSIVTGNISRPESTERVFTVKVHEIFKGEEKIKEIANNTSYVNISTAVHSATCGTEIPLNKDYFISGKPRLLSAISGVED